MQQTLILTYFNTLALIKNSDINKLSFEVQWKHLAKFFLFMPFEPILAGMYPRIFTFFYQVNIIILILKIFFSA